MALLHDFLGTNLHITNKHLIIFRAYKLGRQQTRLLFNSIGNAMTYYVAWRIVYSLTRYTVGLSELLSTKKASTKSFFSHDR
jgi:hypothetical protein